MARKTYAFVGNWGFAPAPKGISAFQYHMEDGSLTPLTTILPEIAAGQLCLDEERNILYAVNECGERPGEIGGGGSVLSFQINTCTGELTLQSRQDSLAPEPSYLCMTLNRRYLITCHCADPWHVTKIVRHEDGSYGNEVLFDDTALVMFPILEDGSIGPACDVMLTQGTGGKGPRSKCSVDPVTNHIQLVEVISRLHAVIRAPHRNLFVTCDKGMDKLITFKVDEENGRFLPCSEYQVEEVASFPRYGAFHPTLPLFYANNENLAMLNTFRYDEDGNLELAARTDVVFEDPGMVDGKPVGAQDILILPDGKAMYVTLCGTHDIAVLSLDENGMPTLVQMINSRGNLPRGLCLSPDGRFLLSGNMVSRNITVFAVGADGTLTDTGRTYDAVSPSAIRMLTVDEEET